MPPRYQPLHGNGSSRSTRWADNPEACGIRCVVGITLVLLFLCAVFPLLFSSWSRKPAPQQVESKTLIVPQATSTVLTTLPPLTTTSISKATSTPSEFVVTDSGFNTSTNSTNSSNMADLARGTDNSTRSNTKQAPGASAGAAAAASNHSETGTTSLQTTSSRTGTETSTATTTMTISSTVSTVSTTTTTNTTAQSTSSSTSTANTTKSTSSASTTSVTSVTTTTTLDPLTRARLACKAQNRDTSEIKFPVSFECDDGDCPHGWTCSGRTQLCSAESFSDACGQQMAGSKYLSVGGDPHETSAAASPVFMLPDGSDYILVQAGGLTGADAGLSLHMASDGHEICMAESDTSLRGSASKATERRCDSLSLHGGQGVYLLLRAAGAKETAALFADNIALIDQQGKNITRVLVVPNAKPKLPKLSGSAASHSGSGGDDASSLDWILPPEHCCDGSRPIIATYAGKDKLPYIDGAVMLGLSLQWHVPEFPRLCMVIRTMAQKNKDLLSAAGWTLVDIDEWHPSEDHFARDYWWMVYNKIDVFRVKVDKLLWMDSDMYVWDDSLRDVLESTKVPKGHIAMVRDCAAKNFNSGLMLLTPDLNVYKRLRAGMTTHHGWDGLDQPLVNKEFEGKVVELDPKFNTHGEAKSCEGVVCAHYTGRHKPTLANVHNLKLVSDGFRNIPYTLRCPRLYEEYFCAMKNARNYLSEELQAALREAGDGHACFS